MNRWSSDIPLEDRLSTLEISKDELPKTTTLGIIWEARKDVFTFQVEPPDVNKAPTKRNVLSAIGSLFDPLQSLEPLTVRAKIIMQEVWMANVGWDELLPDDLNAKWEKWVTELPQLSDIAVPHCLRLATPQTTSIQMHTSQGSTEKRRKPSVR